MKKCWVAIGCVLLGLVACDDNSYRESPVPYAPVQYTIHITTEHPNFMKDNGFQTLSPITERRFDNDFIGYAGLLVWVDGFNNYRAADLCCPNCLNRNKPIKIDGMFAVCPTCGEQFDLVSGFGTPQTGVTGYSLKPYHVRESNTMSGYKLVVSN